MCPVAVARPNTLSNAARVRSARIMTRRRGHRSVSAPAKRPTSNHGAGKHAVTTPTATGFAVIAAASSGTATLNAPSPATDTAVDTYSGVIRRSVLVGAICGSRPSWSTALPNRSGCEAGRIELALDHALTEGSPLGDGEL